MWKLVLAPVVALLLATGVACAVGLAVFYATGGRGNASDKLENLGPGLLALGGGLLVGVGATVVLLVAAANRLLPPGRRGGAIAGTLLAVPAAGVLLGVLGSSVPDGSLGVTLGGDLVSIAVLIAPSTAFLVAGRGARWRPRADGSRDLGAAAGVVAVLLLAALVAAVLVVAVVRPA